MKFVNSYPKTPGTADFVQNRPFLQYGIDI